MFLKVLVSGASSQTFCTFVKTYKFKIKKEKCSVNGLILEEKKSFLYFQDLLK